MSTPEEEAAVELISSDVVHLIQKFLTQITTPSYVFFSMQYFSISPLHLCVNMDRWKTLEIRLMTLVTSIR